MNSFRWFAFGLLIGLIPVFMTNHGLMPRDAMKAHCERYGISALTEDRTP